MFWLKLIVSLAAIALVAVHLIWPDLPVDAITIGLLVVAILPWLSRIIESVKFPGGWEVKLRDLQKAGEKITTRVSDRAAPASLPEFLDFAQGDPNLALVALRIEIEKRLRRLAQELDMPDRMPLTRMFSELHQRELLDKSVFGALQEIALAGNSAAHGARVEPSVQDWALSVGPEILAVLENLLEPPEG